MHRGDTGSRFPLPCKASFLLQPRESGPAVQGTSRSGPGSCPGRGEKCCHHMGVSQPSRAPWPILRDGSQQVCPAALHFPPPPTAQGGLGTVQNHKPCTGWLFLDGRGAGLGSSRHESSCRKALWDAPGGVAGGGRTPLHPKPQARTRLIGPLPPPDLWPKGFGTRLNERHKSRAQWGISWDLSSHQGLGGQVGVSSSFFSISRSGIFPPCPLVKDSQKRLGDRKQSGGEPAPWCPKSFSLYDPQALAKPEPLAPGKAPPAICSESSGMNKAGHRVEVETSGNGQIHH